MVISPSRHWEGECASTLAAHILQDEPPMLSPNAWYYFVRSEARPTRGLIILLKESEAASGAPELRISLGNEGSEF